MFSLTPASSGWRCCESRWAAPDQPLSRAWFVFDKMVSVYLRDTIRDQALVPDVVGRDGGTQSSVRIIETLD
jgi:hypothetical protein